MHESEQVVQESLEAGARGYVLKSDAGRELIAAIEALRRRQPFFTSRFGALALESFLKREQRPARSRRVPGALTHRESEVLQLLAEGRSNREVGVVLGISTKTAETHRARVMKKLAVDSVAEMSATRSGTASSKRERALRYAQY